MVNLFPLRSWPGDTRIFRYRHPEPQKLLGFLRNTGWHAFLRGEEVWVLGVNPPQTGVPLVGEERPRNPTEQIRALNSHLNQLLAQKGFYRTQGAWIDPKDHVEISVSFAKGPFRGRPFAVRLHRAYQVEAVRLEDGFYVLVDLGRQVLSLETLGTLDPSLPPFFQEQAPEQPLRALDMDRKRVFSWEKAPPSAHLLLHPAHLAALEAPASLGAGTRRASQDAFAHSQFSFEELLERVGIFSEFLESNPLSPPATALGQVERGHLRMGLGTSTKTKDLLRLKPLQAPGTSSFLPVFPRGESLLGNPIPSGRTQDHVWVRTRKGEWQNSGTTYTRNQITVEHRALLLFHLVSQEKLSRSGEGRSIQALMKHFKTPSFLRAWEDLGGTLELVLPPVVYDPRTGVILEGGGQEADVCLVLAPMEVGREALRALSKALRRSCHHFQVVNPDTWLGAGHLFTSWPTTWP